METTSLTVGSLHRTVRRIKLKARCLLRRISYLVMLLNYLFAAESYALKENLRFERRSVRHGLSQNTVRDILQDRQGFIWFATQDGLNRYDGYSFHKYRHNLDDPHTLSSNFILCLAADSSGSLWIGSFRGGLCRLDRSTDTMVCYQHDPADSSSLSDDNITALCISNQDKETLWVGTDGSGLDRFNINSGHCLHYRHDPGNPNTLSNDHILDVYQDRSGLIWIGTQNGLNSLDVRSGAFQRYLNDTTDHAGGGGNVINCLFQDRSGRLWIGSENGLYILNKDTGRFVTYRNDPTDPYRLSNNKIKSICEDSLGRIWIATWNGLNRFDPEKNRFIPFHNRPDYPFSLSHNSLYSLYCDRSGILWIGTYSQGINYYDRNRNKFLHYHHDPQDPNSLCSDIVKALYEDRDGMLWIGTYMGGLDRFDRKNGIFTHFVHHSKDPNSLSSNSIISIFEDRAGFLWISTTDNGLNKYDRTTQRFIHYKNDPQNPHSLSSNFVNSVYEDSKGTLWVGTTAGLNKLDRATGQFYRYTHDPNNPASLSHNRAKAIYEDRSGVLWIVTDLGINRFDPQHETFLTFKHERGNSNSLSYDIAVSIYESPSMPGILWIATYGGGLNRFDVKNATFSCYREKDGLPSDMVYGILEDSTGYFWISTDGGLCRFDPRTGDFKDFDSRDGVQGNEFNLALCKSKDGMMFFGGMDGFNAFYPEQVKDDSYIPPVVITDLTLFNKSVPVNKEVDGRVVLTRCISEIAAIDLSYKDAIFAFEFAALNFSIPERSLYAYRMEGVDQEWIRTDAGRRNATYTHLDGGHYTFRVKASNSDGLWNEAGAAITVHILPPFWQTSWFRIFFVLAAITLLYTINRVRSRSIQLRDKELELMVQQRTEKIQQQAQELETLDRIVNLISRELVLDRLFNALLQQGLKLQSKADKGILLILDEKAGCFRFAAVVGYDLPFYREIHFTREEILGLYASQSEQVEKNIYIIRNFAYPANNEYLSKLPHASSLIIMVITVHGKLEGFLVFESAPNFASFDHSDAKRLVRFRSHAISAITRAKMLQDLRDKNQEIVRAQQQLITQQKLASLGALTAGIAHEIKNPLNFVNNFAELSVELVQELKQLLSMEQKGLSDRTMAKEIEEVLMALEQNCSRIREHGKRADSIVHNMLQHSRGKSGERRPTNINHILEEDVNLAYHGMRAQDSQFNIKLEMEFDPTIGPVEVVPQDISRVFLNIITNGCYEAYKKRIARGEGTPPTLRVQTHNLGDMVEVRIRDNGNGVPAAIRDKLFSPFFTTKPPGQGTGLGLSISYDIIVQGHKGQLAFETEEGEYTEFIIRLPKS